MALEIAFGELHERLKSLESAFSLLQTFIEDKPGRGALPAERLTDAVTDLLANTRRAAKLAAEAKTLIEKSNDVIKASRMLTEAQDAYNRMAQRFQADMVHYEVMSDLNELGTSRKGEWPSWANNVRDFLELCRQPLQDVNQALFRCWQEVAGRLGMTAVSVHATNIGQQITTAGADAIEVEQEGVT